MKFLSGMDRRAFPMKGRKINEETLKMPTRKPISPSLDPDRKR
jgi:hypothetical protein